LEKKIKMGVDGVDLICGWNKEGKYNDGEVYEGLGRKQTKIQKLINHNWGLFPNVGLHPDAI